MMIGSQAAFNPNTERHLEPSRCLSFCQKRISRWDRYLGMTAAMTQVLCPHGYLLGDDVEILMAGDDVFFIKD